MKGERNGFVHGSDAEDVRVEALEELTLALRRFPDKLRVLRDLIAKQLAPEMAAAECAPVLPERKPA